MSKQNRWSLGKKIAVSSLSALGTIAFVSAATAIGVLHNYCKLDDYEPTAVETQAYLIAHRGMRSVAPENSVASFEEAGKHGYKAAECDIYMTKDGVWVVSHDYSTYRMMDKNWMIESRTYEELMKLVFSNGSNFERFPHLRFCTLEEYLEICKRYGMDCVIELKGKNNTEHYDKVLELVEKYGVNYRFISFQFEDLKKMRELTDVQMFYLVKEITPESIELAKSIENCGIDFDGNRAKNLDTDIIEKCIAEGLDMCTWTINDVSVMNKLIGKGVTNITTDQLYYK